MTPAWGLVVLLAVAVLVAGALVDSLVLLALSLFVALASAAFVR